jgi:hypothetical protein
MEAYWTMIREQVMNLLMRESPEMARRLRGKVEEDFTLIATLWGDSIKLWFSPRTWISEMTIPLAHLAESKEWIVAPEGIECLAAPALGLDSELQDPTHCFSPRLEGILENRGGYVTEAWREGIPVQTHTESLIMWSNSRKTPEGVNPRIYGASIPQALSTTRHLYITIGVAVAGIQNAWAQGFVPEGRKTI